MCIYIYIYKTLKYFWWGADSTYFLFINLYPTHHHHHHHHHVMMTAWISLYLSNHPALLDIAFAKSSRQDPTDTFIKTSCDFHSLCHSQQCYSIANHSYTLTFSWTEVAEGDMTVVVRALFIQQNYNIFFSSLSMW